ncbi:DUF6745 domain-containing protein [Nonomuraea jiangxiensis]|uniref:DUF6745 domain-containing protein n=1 Tax=Nonomuraea jiangxiensis TaxID=633440 RepID=A0A1G8UPW0_9ACTN|nr:hypothetical protein [Nonomuraea jiangxiensis]SDJ55714.1 hypothetical protein SAMN05421869_11155 [Nonomuraea jiangxiensis]
METLTWERLAFATGPGEDPESAVRQAYREAGLAEPERVVVLPSPLAGAVAAAWLTGGDDVRGALETAARGALEAAGRGALEAAGRGAPETAGRGALEAAGRAGVEAAGRAGVESGGGFAGIGPAIRAVEALGEPGRSVRHEVRTVPWERARAAAQLELGAAGWSALWAETGGRLWPRVDRLVTDLRRAIARLGEESLDGEHFDRAGLGGWRLGGEGLGGERLGGEGLAGRSARAATLDAVLGQHDAPWLSAFDGLDGLKRVAERAGWWWPYERLAIVTERPAELHLDELGRPHRADGPAMAYSDGFGLHAWHGMPVPAGFAATMSDLTPARIRDEDNAELRRVMLEHFGLDRYLAESGAQPVHSDETGKLWRVELSDDEPLVMVEVVNSTPEPDGTRRTYFLRVPPWVSRAREGVAWTFGVAETDYRPARET